MNNKNNVRKNYIRYVDLLQQDSENQEHHQVNSYNHDNFNNHKQHEQDYKLEDTENMDIEFLKYREKMRKNPTFKIHIIYYISAMCFIFNFINFFNNNNYNILIKNALNGNSNYSKVNANFNCNEICKKEDMENLNDFIKCLDSCSANSDSLGIRISNTVELTDLIENFKSQNEFSFIGVNLCVLICYWVYCFICMTYKNDNIVNNLEDRNLKNVLRNDDYNYSKSEECKNDIPSNSNFFNYLKALLKPKINNNDLIMLNNIFNKAVNKLRIFIHNNDNNKKLESLTKRLLDYSFNFKKTEKNISKISTNKISNNEEEKQKILIDDKSISDASTNISIIDENDYYIEKNNQDRNFMNKKTDLEQIFYKKKKFNQYA
jgi:hypothetical protein